MGQEDESSTAQDSPSKWFKVFQEGLRATSTKGSWRGRMFCRSFSIGETGILEPSFYVLHGLIILKHYE